MNSKLEELIVKKFITNAELEELIKLKGVHHVEVCGNSEVYDGYVRCVVNLYEEEHSVYVKLEAKR